MHSLANTAATASVRVIGIYYAGNTTTGPNLISRNLVHCLAIASTGVSWAYGMHFDTGSFTAQNNMVRVGIDASGASTAGASVVGGLFDLGGSASRKFYHNSVWVGGTQTSGSNPTSAFISGGATNARYFRNNIFANVRGNSAATSKHYAVVDTGLAASPTPAGLTANNNLFFVSGAGGVLGLFDDVDRTTLGEWQAATGQDVSSAVADPLFVNPTGDAATVDLHLQPNNPAGGGGLPVAEVIDDFDGQTRGGLTPVDIGADAGDFTSTGDIYAPAISYPPLTNGSTANRILTGWASVEDNGGSVASGVTAPRLYYKKASDADVFGGNTAADNGWKYVTATGDGSPYSFTVDYSLLNGGSVIAGDIIQYFVVSQDAANNLASSPAAASFSTMPPMQNINRKPAAGLNSYNIVTPISSPVTVGPTGTYPSLTGAGGLFAALNSGVLTGDLAVNLTGDISEDGGIALQATMQDNYPHALTVTLQPDSAAMRTISGSSESGLIRLSGAKRVTIDGSFGGSGRFLTFRNTNTNGPTIALIDDASNNTVRNCVVEGVAGSSMAGGLSPDNPCVVLFGTGIVTGNDNNLVTGNQIRDRSDAAGVPGYLIFSRGTSDEVANSNNTVSNNDLFNFGSYGVLVLSGSESWSITGNKVFQTAPRTTQMIGIVLNGLGTNTIRGNNVHDLTTSGSATGISLLGQTGNTTVEGNRIWNIGNRPESTGAAYGLYLRPGAGQVVTVVNNMVALGSSGNTTQKLCGIGASGTTGSTTVVIFNSVLLTGTGWYSDTWAFNSLGTSAATVKNNIFLNLRTSGGRNQFAANLDPASTGPLTMDSNVYAGTGSTIAENFFDASNGIATIGMPIPYAQWQVNVPSDTHSSADNPGGNYTSAMFVDPANGNLHLVPTGNVLVNNTGTPVAGVTTDYDGDIRSLTTPDIGADELRAPFPQWAQANAVGEDPNSPGANGFANLLNFSFDLNPAVASRNELRYTGNAITPGGITTQILSGTATAEFIRRADYVAAGLTYHAQFSADLSHWETDNTPPTVLATDGVNEVVGLDYPLLSGGAQARFFRVVVDLQ